MSLNLTRWTVQNTVAPYMIRGLHHKGRIYIQLFRSASSITFVDTYMTPGDLIPLIVGRFYYSRNIQLNS